MVDANISDAEIEKWMKSYYDKVSDRFGGNVLDLYAVLDGKIVAANPWEGDDSYDYAAKSRYSDAVAATPGTIGFPICTEMRLPDRTCLPCPMRFRTRTMLLP